MSSITQFRSLAGDLVKQLSKDVETITNVDSRVSARLEVLRNRMRV
jgi:hypothetical protein